MSRHSNTDRIETGGCCQRNFCAFRKNECHRSGKEAVYEKFCVIRYRSGEQLDLIDRSYVSDKRIVLRTLLRFEYLADSFRIKNIRAKSVDSLRRERDDPAAANNLCRDGCVFR